MRLLRLPLPCALALLLLACGRQAPPQAEVVAADGVLCDLSQRLAGADLQVECLLQPGEDPHQLQLTPRQSQALRQARLVLINGYGLTPALADQRGAIAVAELAVPDSPPLSAKGDHGHDHGHRHSGAHSAAHGESERDPHVWHDPRQAAAMVAVVSRQLQQLEPAAAAAIAARAQAMQNTLAALHRWNQQQFASLPAPRLLASGHRSFASLARAYQLQELPLVDGGSSAEVLRPQALQANLSRLRQQPPARLFAEQLPASRSLQRVSALSGIPIATEPLQADGLAPASGGKADLISTLTANTCLIAEQLQGRCNRRSQQQLIERWQAIR